MNLRPSVDGPDILTMGTGTSTNVQDSREFFSYRSQFPDSYFPATMLGTFLSPATTRIGSVCQRALATSTSASIMSFYTLSAVKGDGTVQSMQDFRGKVVYATNVASM